MIKLSKEEKKILIHNQLIKQGYEDRVAEVADALNKQAKKGKGTSPEGTGGASKCVCPSCGATVTHKKGTPCINQKCPECGTAMTGQGAVGDKTAALDKIKETLKNRKK